MPKLTVAQWLYLFAFLALYGVVVHGLTRAYYESRAVQTRATPAAVTQQPSPTQATGIAGTSTGRLGPSPRVREILTMDDPVMLARLGDRLFEEQAFQQAVVAYERAVELDPTDVDSYNDLGLSLHYLGRSSEAIGVLQQGINKRSDYQRIHLTMGFVQLQTGNREAAISALERAVELGPDNPVGDSARRMLEQAR